MHQKCLNADHQPKVRLCFLFVLIIVYINCLFLVVNSLYEKIMLYTTLLKRDIVKKLAAGISSSQVGIYKF